MSVHAIVVAAGRGVRAGGDLPKQCAPDSDAPLEVTNMRTTTIDNSQQPPQEKLVSEGRRVGTGARPAKSEQPNRVSRK